LSAGGRPAWESKSDWEIYKGIAKVLRFASDTLDKKRMSCCNRCNTTLRQSWRSRLTFRTGGKANAILPGKTAPNIAVVERDYPATYERFTSLGPLMDKLGNGGKGIAWVTQAEVDFLGKLNYTKREGAAKARPLIDTALDASEVILAPGTGNKRSGWR
jgi:nitrate reductase alpha subunit